MTLDGGCVCGERESSLGDESSRHRAAPTERVNWKMAGTGRTMERPAVTVCSAQQGVQLGNSCSFEASFPLRRLFARLDPLGLFAMAADHSRWRFRYGMDFTTLP
jgi:hypothetical protein